MELIKKEDEIKKEMLLLKTKQHELDKSDKETKVNILILNENIKNLRVKTNEILTKMNNSLIDVTEVAIKTGERFIGISNDFEKIKENIKNLQQENITIKKILERNKDFLTYNDVCTALNIANLDNTILKYYMYEQGIFDMKINKFHNTFKISKDYELSNCGLKEHMHIEGRTVLFKPSAIDYFNGYRKEIKETVSRYLRRLEQFNISRERVSSQHVKNYQEEICKICGIKNSYDADKWGKLYHVYEKNNPNYKKNYKFYREQYEKEHPDTTYIPSQLTYLVNICNSGDTLLKIACELFVD